GPPYDFGPAEVYANVVTSGGALVAPAPVQVSPVPGNQESPSVAFDGTNYLVVWADSGALDSYGTRVTPGLTVLDPSGFLLTGGSGWQVDPKVASNGSGWFAIWADIATGVQGIYGTRISPAGSVLDPSGILVTNLSTVATIASDGAGYMTVLRHASD